MTLTKKNLISRICEETEFTKKQSGESLEKIIGIIKSALEAGDEVMISGFGKFGVKKKNERKGRNLSTGDEVILSAHKVVTFKSSLKLKKRMNGG